jgi:hypothetical protein
MLWVASQTYDTGRRRTMSTPLDRLRHHVTGAIERGEAEPIVEQPVTGVKIEHRITQQEHDSAFNGWADNASRACDAGFRVVIEGVDWAQACQDHGFYGAISKVKAGRRNRYAAKAAGL